MDRGLEFQMDVQSVNHSKSESMHRQDLRPKLVKQYIKGNGIEIGALHQPLQVSNKTANVRYVDRLSVPELREHYPELADLNLQNVDIVDNGELLTSFSESSVDFIIANHFLEHTQDPVRTIKRHVEVLRDNGILYLAVPDKRFTFDRLREVTSLEHFRNDHSSGPETSYLDHVHEYVKKVDCLTGIAFEEKVQQIIERNYSIHFHVWDASSLKEFMNRLIIEEQKVPVQLVEFVENPAREECICILRKNGKSTLKSLWAKIRRN